MLPLHGYSVCRIIREIQWENVGFKKKFSCVTYWKEKFGKNNKIY